MRAVELFAGAGGIALGVSRAGFSHEAVVELNEDCCATLRRNAERGTGPLAGAAILQRDVRELDYSVFRPGTDLLAGGVPCQPFSIGGKHRGHCDERNLFPEFLRAVRSLKPKAILIENVKGLVRESFARYFNYILLQLAYPEVVKRPREAWLRHFRRLERHHTGGKERGLSYRVVFRLLNAADYGVPQRRERVFIVGFRADIGVEWSFPEPTHSIDRLLWDQHRTREYWNRHGISKREVGDLPRALRARIRNVAGSLFEPERQPWRTVRDAISDLPPLREGETASSIANHYLNPGARPYPGHTGSRLDEPAKTLKAGVHGVPGGENTVCLRPGKVRYFTVREAARLQAFPDDYVFAGAWSEAMRQLGNAVPVQLAHIIAANIRRKLTAT